MTIITPFGWQKSTQQDGGGAYYPIAQQQAALIVLIVGLILSIAVFAVAIWRVLRRVAAWQQSGANAIASLHITRKNGDLIALRSARRRAYQMVGAFLK